MTPSPTPHFELGIASFGDFTPDPATGAQVSPQQRMKDLLEEIELADQVGLDVFALGEHHRPDYLISSPATVLAAAATLTKNVRLSSAVTVLSTDDPVRVFQQFATLDLISGGRAEIMAGRGSFSESFPLFMGDAPIDYDGLFRERLDLLLTLREHTHVTWTGQTRPSLQGEGVYPRPLQDPLPVWLAIGGTPNSARRAGTLGLPLALAIIGGLPEQFRGLIDLYRASGQAAGFGPDRLKVSINSHGLIADDSRVAADTMFPVHKAVFEKLGQERGWRNAVTRDAFERDRSLRGAYFTGDPQEVADKILYQHEVFGHDRFTLQNGGGTLPHAVVMRSIELLGTQVAPVVRAEIARRTGAAG